MNSKPLKKICFLLSLVILGAPSFLTQAAAKSTTVSEGVAFYAFPTQEPGTLPIYRFTHKKTSGSFLTTSEEEKNSLTGNKSYKYEGVLAYTHISPLEGTTPVLRLRHKKKGNHLFTISDTEKATLLANKKSGFLDEGFAFYAYAWPPTGSVAIERIRNKKSASHAFKVQGTSNEAAPVDDTLTPSASLGPEITVGVWSYKTSYLKKKSFKIKANKNYRIVQSDGTVVADVLADTQTSVRYKSSGKLRILGLASPAAFDREVRFEAADGNNSDLIFEVSKPDEPFDKYRGKIKLRYSTSSKKVWVINTLPLEQYVWGMGEITGTGDEEYNKVMTTLFRSYGFWKIQYSTQYAKEGFKVNATPGNQLYYGYNWEKGHSRIKEAALVTQGLTVEYQNDIALTPYSSWTDGRTRSFEDVWGSRNYPHLQSVSDPYGKHPSWSTSKLKKSGNHMVGLSAHGALKLANDHNWSWQRILKYYYTGIKLAVPANY